MPLLNLSHQTQKQQSDCLAACAAMLLSALGIKFRYSHLVRLLKTRYYGTAFENLALLESLGVKIEIDRSDDFNNIEVLTKSLERGEPLVVAVETSELQTYWTHSTSHAVVVVGIDEQNVLLNDPAFEDAPKIVPINEFLIAWGEQDYRYAILTKNERS
ncbi:MAG: cysteine peptidase family C39 domain-containing protein [Chloroflexota bacterium]